MADSNTSFEAGGIVEQTKFRGKYTRIYRAKAQTSLQAKEPLLLLHGAPESHEIWLPSLARLSRDRDCYLVSLPSEISDAPTPSVLSMVQGLVIEDFEACLNTWAQDRREENEKFIVVAHDFGARWAFAWLRHYPKQYDLVSAIATFSVGPRFRFDMSELGLVGALTWCYSLPFSLSYYIPNLPLTDLLLRTFAEYRGKLPVTHKGLWWYYYGPIWPFRLIFDMMGASYILCKLGFIEHGCDDDDYVYLTSRYPMFFAAHPKFDRIAFTRKYVKALEGHTVIMDNSAGHFLISNKSKSMSALYEFLDSLP